MVPECVTFAAVNNPVVVANIHYGRSIHLNIELSVDICTFICVCVCIRGSACEGGDEEQPDQRHPLPSYLHYKYNSSIKSYQTGFFPSRCSEGPDIGSIGLEINVGSGMDSLGGPCDPRESVLDPETRRDLNLFCDGPLKPRTSYRYCMEPNPHKKYFIPKN